MPVEDPRVRLRRAACEGNLHLIKRLIAKTNLQNPDPVNGWTTLMYATRYGHDRVVEYLLNNGHEKVELSRDFDNNTILMVASQYNFVEIMKLYITSFPNSVNMVNKQGQTALIYAAKYGNLEPIKLLLEYGADINQTDFEGNTALHYAAAWERFDAVTILIERECQFALKNHSGWTALDYSYSMELKSHLQECALSHHEESKINRRRAHLKINVDSLISIDSIPTTVRSATYPPGRPSEPFDSAPNESYPNENLSPNVINPVKRKESLPW